MSVFKIELSELQEDAIKEVINIGVGKGAESLNQLLNTHIHLEIPNLKIVSNENLSQALEYMGKESLSTVNLKFSGDLEGSSILIFPEKSAVNLVTTLMGDEFESSEMDALKSATLNEVGNILINNVMGSISNMLDKRLDYRVPVYGEKTIHQLIDEEEELSILLIETRFTLESLRIYGDLLMAFGVSSYKDLIRSVDAMLME